MRVVTGAAIHESNTFSTIRTDLERFSQRKFLEGEAVFREFRDTQSEIGGFLAEEVTRAISSLASMRARTGYAFRIIDPPLVPDKKSWPPRLVLLVLIGMIAAAVELGVVAGMLLRGSTSGRHSTH